MHERAAIPWLVALALAGCDDPTMRMRDGAPPDAFAVDAPVHVLEAGTSDASSVEDAASFDAGSTRDCPRLGPWQASEPWGDAASHPMPSFALGSRFYVHTAGDRALQVADVASDGTLGPWRNAGDHGGGPHGFTAVALGDEAFHFRNGHIARYRFLTDGSLAGDVELLEESVDTAFGGNRYVWDVAVPVVTGGDARGIVHLGGFSFTGYTYRPHVMRSDFPVAARFERTGDFPTERPGNAAFVATGAGEGWIFARQSAGDRFFRARVSGASVGAFEELAPLPAGDDNGRGDVLALDCSLFVVRGSRVFAADVGADGTLRAFEEQPALPEAQIDVSWGDGHQEGASWGVAQGHVHLTGARRVFSAPIVR